MSGAADLELRIDVEGRGTVPALLRRPKEARALLALAHGAGAGMRHAFLEGLSAALAARGIATLRWDFPYVAAGRRAPDRAPVLQACVRAAVAEAGRRAGGLPLLAGGKSMGGRMTSLAAEAPLPGVRGLVFFGFPLHRPGDGSDARADHLPAVNLPMLFLQGTRDRLAEAARIRRVCAALGPRVTLHVVEGADHGFAVPKRAGRTGDDVAAELAGAVAAWAAGV
ncbi:MAG: alpha/beta family hydrolase [Gemmatimonadota bacterium]|nr:alpha/beta family hydrolase [Gemmatimonadota bacterium]